MIKSSTTDIEKVFNEELSELWSILSFDEKRTIVDNFNIHKFRKNDVIYREGEQPERLWCLLKGKVKLYKEGIGGRQQILRLYRPVQYFGYRAWFASELYVSSAAAFESTTLGSIPMNVVSRMITGNIRLAWFFIHELSRHLGGADTKIVNLTQKHIRGRLAESLTLLIDSYGYEDDGQTLRIYLAREEIANLSNMTTPNAIRTLLSFAEEGIITVDGRRIKIVNEALLRKISRTG